MSDLGKMMACASCSDRNTSLLIVASGCLLVEIADLDDRVEEGVCRRFGERADTAGLDEVAGDVAFDQVALG